MTQPDVIRKSRNLFGALGIAGIAASYTCVHIMGFWQAPPDYWYAWAAFFTGFVGVGCSAGAVGCHIAYLDTLRSN